MNLRVVILVTLATLAPGCGPAAPRLAKVSGRVTLDGKPLPKASVTFAPMATKERPNPGPTAQGTTDEEGRYQLTLGTEANTAGAVVGKCRIYITTMINPALDDRDAGGPRPKTPDRVPDKYKLGTELTFDVPPGGTDQANFDLTSN